MVKPHSSVSKNTLLQLDSPARLPPPALGPSSSPSRPFLPLSSSSLTPPPAAGPRAPLLCRHRRRSRPRPGLAGSRAPCRPLHRFFFWRSIETADTPSALYTACRARASRAALTLTRCPPASRLVGPPSPLLSPRPRVCADLGPATPLRRRERDGSVCGHGPARRRTASPCTASRAGRWSVQVGHTALARLRGPQPTVPPPPPRIPPDPRPGPARAMLPVPAPL